MAEGISTRLTPKEGRKFGVLVGAVFLGIGGISLWRGHVWPPRVFVVVGALLVLGGLLMPGRMGPVYRAWMGLAHLLSKVTTPVFLGAVYFVVMTPIGLIRRALGKNPLRHRAINDSYWKAPTSGGKSDLTTQF
jgi:hypothetical protein